MKKLLYFRADWCGPCRQMSAVISDVFETWDLADRYTLERVDVDAQPELAARMGIRGIPTMVILDEQGQEEARRIGVMPKRQLQEWLADQRMLTASVMPCPADYCVLKQPSLIKRVWNKVKTWLGLPITTGPDDFRRTCPDTIFFNADSAGLTAKAASDLDQQIAWLRRNPGYSLLIEGHCDSTGTVEYNLNLGEKRAMAVKRYFETHMDIKEGDVQIVSYGKQRPWVYEHGEQDRALNRRAVTILR